MTYELCKKVIFKGNYNIDDMLDKLDLYLLADRITDEQYKELVEIIKPIQK